MREALSDYVDAWHEANRDDVGIGVVKVPLLGSVDLFPDRLERAIMKKLWMAILTNLLEVEFEVAGVPMKMSPVRPAASSSPAGSLVQRMRHCRRVQHAELPRGGAATPSRPAALAPARLAPTLEREAARHVPLSKSARSLPRLAS